MVIKFKNLVKLASSIGISKSNLSYASFSNLFRKQATEDLAENKLISKPIVSISYSTSSK